MRGSENGPCTSASIFSRRRVVWEAARVRLTYGTRKLLLTAASFRT